MFIVQITQSLHVYVFSRVTGDYILFCMYIETILNESNLGI